LRTVFNRLNGRFDACQDDLLDIALFRKLPLFQLLLLFEELAGFVRVQALVFLQQLVELLLQSDIIRPEFIDPGLIDRAFSVQNERTVALDVVLPFNNPPHFPQYNGAMEKSIGDLKRRLSERLAASCEGQALVASIEATVHELNHRPRRSLGGKTACEVYHDPGLRLRFNRQTRGRVLRLLQTEFLETIQSMAPGNHRPPAAVWRRVVESWLRRQGLISIDHQPKPNQNVSTIFPKKWSHN
jgi:hypothetical protein